MRRFSFILVLLNLTLSGCVEMHPVRILGVSGGPLHWAAANGNNERIIELVSQGANVDLKAKTTDATPLHHAAWKGNSKAALLLINMGANVNAKTDWWATPLHYAAGAGLSVPGYGYTSPGLSEGHFEVAKLLIEHGADVNNTERMGDTPLGHAAAHNASEIAQLLIDQGADVNAREYQYSVLERAVARGPDVARLLINHGAQVNTMDAITQTTPLHIAADLCRNELVELLLLNGANVNARNSHGNTPRKMASCPETSAIIESYIAGSR